MPPASKVARLNTTPPPILHTPYITGLRVWHTPRTRRFITKKLLTVPVQQATTTAHARPSAATLTHPSPNPHPPLTHPAQMGYFTAALFIAACAALRLPDAAAAGAYTRRLFSSTRAFFTREHPTHPNTPSHRLNTGYTIPTRTPYPI